MWDKIELYIISLWLLFILVIISTIKIPIYFGPDWKFIGFNKLINTNIIPIISLSFIIIGFFSIGRFKYKLEGSKNTPLVITKLDNGNYEHLTFLTTYIVPLISLNLSEIRNVVILFMLLIAIGAISIKTHMFYANPTLALLGFHIYKVNGKFRTGERENITLIARERLELGMSVYYKKLDEKIYFVRVVK